MRPSALAAVLLLASCSKTGLDLSGDESVDETPSADGGSAPAKDASVAKDAGAPPTPFEIALDWIELPRREDPTDLTFLPGETPLLVVASRDGSRGALRAYRPPSAEVLQEIIFERREIIGVLGYNYDLRPGQPPRPVLAVITHEYDPQRFSLLLFRRRPTGGLELMQETYSECPTSSCREPNGDCPGDPAEWGCARTVGFETGTRLRARDVNRDGFADLVFAFANGIALETMYSAPKLHSLEPLQLPPFEQTCVCSLHGRLVSDFDLVELGGPGTLPGLDLAQGDPAGAFLLYAEEESPYRLPCSTDRDCPGDGEFCEPVCTFEERRCVRRCDATCADPDATCDPTTGLCIHAQLPCRQAQSILPLERVAFLEGGPLTGSGADDLVIGIGGSPVPGEFGFRLSLLSAGPGDATELPERRLREFARREEAQLIGGTLLEADGQSPAEIATLEPNRLAIWSNLQPAGEAGLDMAERCTARPRIVAGDVDQDGKDELYFVCSDPRVTARRVLLYRAILR